MAKKPQWLVEKERLERNPDFQKLQAHLRKLAESPEMRAVKEAEQAYRNSPLARTLREAGEQMRAAGVVPPDFSDEPEPPATAAGEAPAAASLATNEAADGAHIVAQSAPGEPTVRLTRTAGRPRGERPQYERARLGLRLAFPPDGRAPRGLLFKQIRPRVHDALKTWDRNQGLEKSVEPPSDGILAEAIEALGRSDPASD
jgi:hypothetical protein